jgi:putative FmdB family regulatory protein
MPTYEYVCQSCGHDLEVFQRMSDDPLQICPDCEAPSLKRKIGRGAGIIFKGGGFYETDFKDKKGSSGNASESKADSKSGSSEGSDKSGGTDSAKVADKPAAQSAPKGTDA